MAAAGTAVQVRAGVLHTVETPSMPVQTATLYPPTPTVLTTWHRKLEGSAVSINGTIKYPLGEQWMSGISAHLAFAALSGNEGAQARMCERVPPLGGVGRCQCGRNGATVTIEPWRVCGFVKPRCIYEVTAGRGG